MGSLVTRGDTSEVPKREARTRTLQDPPSRKTCGPKLRNADLERGKQGRGGYLHLEGSITYSWGDFGGIVQWGRYGGSIGV
jgi:hypothetical protein